MIVHVLHTWRNCAPEMATWCYSGCPSSGTRYHILAGKYPGSPLSKAQRESERSPRVPFLSFAMWQRTKPKDEKKPKAQRPRGKMEKWKGSAQVFDLKSGAKKVRRTVLYLDIFYVSFIVHLQAFSKCSSINNLTHSRIPHNSESARPLVVALGLLPAQCFSWDPFKEIYARYSEQQWATVSNSEQQWAIVSNSEQQWATVSNSEQQWATASNRVDLQMTVKSVKICEAATQMLPASELEQLESVRAQCGSSHLCNGVVNEGRSGMGLQPLPASTALVTFYNEQILQYIYTRWSPRTRMLTRMWKVAKLKYLLRRYDWSVNAHTYCRTVEQRHCSDSFFSCWQTSCLNRQHSRPCEICLGLCQ